ncbi:hypothetical protein [Plantactinospora endophytica]|uniref:DUF998 domain-containing protein n=1 Tax=Plantactinospora endophytica TaxID=673535 RepID=A0ABQ4E1V0_9ACTN|nr:hypothetical protein [Plantactinospora endophytica]GIG88693.1 hypothetical protein Pen02_36290 [Plantactinospora endophytica]
MPDEQAVPATGAPAVPPASAEPAAPDPPPTPAGLEAELPGAGPDCPARSSRWRRIGPVVALWLLAPWAAECSWGGFTVDDYLMVVVFLGPLYGGAALLIRETARRTGGGWPAMVLLGAAFGMVQAGLVDQSLFNDAFLDDTEFAEAAASARATMLPGLDFSAQQALSYLSGHVVLSICVPIAIVESFVRRDRRHQPWLGPVGLVVTGILYLLGSLLIFSDDSGRKDFLASPLQLSFAASTVLVLVGAALLPRWRRRRRALAVRAPHPVWAGLVVLGARLAVDVSPTWFGVALGVVASALAGVLIVRWSRRTGWGQRHVLAAWGVGLVVAAVGAYLSPSYVAASPTAALVGDVTVSLLTLALLGGAFWRLRTERPEPATSQPAGVAPQSGPAASQSVGVPPQSGPAEPRSGGLTPRSDPAAPRSGDGSAR